MIHRVHRRDVREQRLRRADVRRRLLAPDVLLARLECHAIGCPAARIDRNADDASRSLSDEGLARREKRCVRSAVAERHAEPLRVADNGVSAHFTRRRQERQRQQIGRDRHQDAGGVRSLDHRTRIHRCAVVVRVLQEQTERVGELLVSERVRRADLQADPKRLRTASQHVQRLRKASIRHQEQTLLPRSRLLRLDAEEHRHRLGRCGAFVEERRGRDVGSGEILDDRLEIEQRLEPALGDLGLIGRVRRVPGRILEDVPKNHARRDAPVVAHPDEGAGNDVALGDPPKTP